MRRLIDLTDDLIRSAVSANAYAAGQAYMRAGRVRRSRIGLGAETVPISLRVRRHFALDGESGAMATTIEPGGPAEAAGLELGGGASGAVAEGGSDPR